MWRMYVSYECPNEDCDYSIQSRIKILRFDQDIYHEQAFESDPEQRQALKQVQGQTCPHCDRPLQWAGWKD